MTDLTAWFFVAVIGVGSCILLAYAGHVWAAWGSAVASSAFIAGIWYLPAGRDDSRRVTGVEWVLMVGGMSGWLWCWMQALPGW